MSPSARHAQAADWLEDLREFGSAIIEDACREWRRAYPDKRPGPGNIRTLCLETQRAARDQRIAIEDASATWPSWLYEIWGPASTGRPKREAALREIEASYRRAEDWRNSPEGKAILGSPMATPVAAATAAALGVRAREYNPSAEDMAAGRRALGLEPREETP